ncbi:MAG: hypothetical protein WCG06_05135 [Candidatus Omnitrophota bacterium]
MIGRLACAAFVVIAGLSPLTVPQACACSAAQQYKITLVRLELKNISGRWIKVFEPDTLVDLIDQKPALAFFNNGRIPPGRYVNFRLSISQTVRVSGRDGAHSTLAGGYTVVKTAAADLSKAAPEQWRYEPLADSAGTQAEAQLMKVEFARLAQGSSAQSPIVLSAARDFEGLTVENGTFIRLGFLLDFDGTICDASASDLARSTAQKPFLYALPPKSASDAVLTVGQTVKAFKSQDLTLTLS